MVFQLCLVCGSTLNFQTLCLGACPRYNLVVDEDVKKPTNQLCVSLSIYLSDSFPSSLSLPLHSSLFRCHFVSLSVYPPSLRLPGSLSAYLPVSVSFSFYLCASLSSSLSLYLSFSLFLCFLSTCQSIYLHLPLS